MTDEINIMLVEDQPEYRDVIKLAIDKTSDLHLASMYGTAEKALSSMQMSLPDVILLDLRLLGMSGIDAIPKFRESSPSTPIIVLTNSNRERDILAAISHGAAGYLLKCASLDQIIEGIHTVMGGGASLDPSVAKLIMRNISDESVSETLSLSKRKMEVLSLLAEGLVKKEIADQLNIAYGTVDSYVKEIYEILQVHNAPAAVDKAHRLGLFRRLKES
jgi:DNA-binding NarL/FixJ family response regulator